MTALTLYGSSVASTTLSTADQLSTTTGGTETSKTTTAPNDSSQNWMELLSQGGSGTDSASQGSPSGKGWIYDSVNLENQQIAAGNWSAVVRMNDSMSFTAITFNIRFYKRSSGGVYTSIGSLTLASQSMSGTTTTYTFSASSLSLMDFSTGDKLYVDFWMHPITGHWTADPIVNFVSNSASAGVANDFVITTPGYSPTPSRTIPATAALLVTSSRTIPATAALQGTFSRTIPATAALLVTNSRTISPNTAALLVTSSRTIPATASLIVRLTSGQFGLWANGTGTATFGSTFRCSQYPDPALSLAPVLPYVSNSSVFWTENIPANTTRAISVSLDGSGNSWTDVTAQNGSTIPIINSSGTVTTDVFTSNTSANYTSTSKTGGSAATWSYDITNSRITATGGSGALYLLNSISASNIDVLCDMDKSDAGGLVWCEVDTSNYYEVGVYDDSSSGGFTNQLRLYKVLSNSRSLLGSASITFHRSTPNTSPYHRIRVVMLSGLITVYFDGVSTITYTDGSPLAAGKCGMRNDAGTSRYYQFRAQALGDFVSGTPSGDIVTGKFLYTRIAPSSSDATTTPQILTLTTSVRGPDVDAGSLIPLLNVQTYPVSVMLNSQFDTLTHASGDYHWNVDKGTQPTFSSQLSFNLRGAKVAPFCFYSTDFLFTPTVVPSGSADLYRDQETIYNCVNTISVTNEPFLADGTKTSWSMSYPLYSAPTIVINGVTQTVGVSGVDTGMSFYWTPNSTSIAQASGATVLTSGTIGYVSYTGIGSRQRVTQTNASGISAQSTLENNSGIVEDVLDGSSVFGLTSLPMTVAQATTYAQGLLSRFSNNNAIDLTATTTSDLLAGRPAPVVGQLFSVWLPEFSINNQQLMVVKVTTTAVQKADSTILYQYQIEATNGASLVNWTQPLF